MCEMNMLLMYCENFSLISALEDLFGTLDVRRRQHKWRILKHRHFSGVKWHFSVKICLISDHMVGRFD